MPIDAIALFKRALLSPGQQKLLDSVTSHSGDIAQKLQHTTVEFTPEELANIDSHPDWVMKLYELIAPVTDSDLDEGAEVRIPAESDLHEEGLIGKAFLNLMRELPRELANLDRVFRELPELKDRDELAFLMKTPAVQSAEQVARPMVRRGLTPLTIFDAANAVSVMVEAMQQRHMLPDNEVPIFPNFGQRKVGSLAAEDISEEIQNLTECDPRASDCIAGWLILVAAFKPLVFPDLRATWNGQTIVLEHAKPKETELGLIDRWSQLTPQNSQPAVRLVDGQARLFSR